MNKVYERPTAAENHQWPCFAGLFCGRKLPHTRKLMGVMRTMGVMGMMRETGVMGMMRLFGGFSD